MFVGVEILNENNHGTKGQNVADFSVPEIQMSLIGNEETSEKLVCSFEKTANKNVKPAATKKKEAFLQKDKWSKDIEFLLSCISLSVGLGNVWRFPYTALQNGGGAFVIPYLIVLIFVGKPIYYMELCLGQFSSRGCVKVYDMAPILRGVGVGQVIATCFVTTYYVSLVGLTIRYFIASFSDPLPWSQCKEEWNTTCIDSSRTSVNSSGERPQSSAELYFLKEILNEAKSIDDGIGMPNWKLGICLVLAWTCICGIMIKGVKSSGKASYFLAVFPYFVMIILLVRSATLPGAVEGMLYFITPKWDKLWTAQVWYAAVTQVFYSLAVCFGSVTMYSSFNRFDQNIYKDVNIITCLDTLTSLLAGFIIFGILGHLAHVIDCDISEVTHHSISLAFLAYPETIAKIDFMPQFFAMLFFFMLFVLGIGTCVGMTSTIMTTIRDKYPEVKCWKVAVGISIVGVAVGSIYTTPGGQFLLSFLDFYGASFIALILAIIELLTVGWIYGVDRFCNDIEFMLGRKTGLYWRICWGFITPAMMIFIFGYFVSTWKPVTYQSYEYHPNMHAFGWCISIFCLLQLPIFGFNTILKQREKTWKKKILNAFKPNSRWGPNEPEKLNQYKEFTALKEATKRQKEPSPFQIIFG